MINKRLINIKNLLRIIISVMVIFSMAKSCAKALTYDDIKEYVNYTADYYSSNSVYQQIKTATNSSTMVHNIPSFISDYNNIYIYKDGNYIWYYCYNATSWNISVTTVRVYGSYKRFAYYLNNPGITSISTNASNYNNSPLSYSYSSTTNDYNNLNGMNYTTEDLTLNYSLPPTYVGNQAIPQWTYLEYVNVIEDNTHNGSLFTFYYQGNLYSQAQLKIGTIHPYDSYYYEINLINNSNNIIVGQCFVSENSYNPYSNGALYIDEHHDLYVNTINLDYSTQYRLEVISYYGTGGSNLYEDIDWYIFLPTNAIISGDSIQNLGSGDYTAKDNTIAVTGAIQEQTSDIVSSINNLIGSLPGSDSSSGDASGDLSSGFDGGTGILGGIFSLFVPDGTFFRSYFTELSNFFSDRLGIIYFPFEFIIDFFNRVLNIDFSNPVMTLGPYTLPLNDDLELVPLITFDFNSYLEEPHLKSIHDVYLVIVDGLLIFGYIQLLRKTYEKMVNNKGG